MSTKQLGQQSWMDQHAFLKCDGTTYFLQQVFVRITDIFLSPILSPISIHKDTLETEWD